MDMTNQTDELYKSKEELAQQEATQKKLKNARILTRLAGIDETKQTLFIREALDYPQIFLLCEMLLYGVPEETIERLADAGASPEVIKETLKAFIIDAEASKQPSGPKDYQKLIEDLQAFITEKFTQTLELYEKITEKTAAKMSEDLLKAMNDNQLKQLEAYEQSSHTLSEEIQKLQSDHEASEKKLMEDFKTEINSFEARTYNHYERVAFFGLKNKLPELSVKQLALVHKALNAGVQPSQLTKYLKTTDEQMELIVHILLVEINSKN